MPDDKKTETPGKVGVDAEKLRSVLSTVNRAWQQNTSLDLVDAYRKLSARNIQSALTRELLQAKEILQKILGETDEDDG